MVNSMIDPRCARPRYPLDDSWLFADPMALAFEYGTVESRAPEEPVVEHGAYEQTNADTVPDRTAGLGGHVYAPLINDELSVGIAKSCAAFDSRPRVRAAPADAGRVRSRARIAVVAGMALAGGLLCGLWLGVADNGPEFTLYESAVAKLSCEGVPGASPHIARECEDIAPGRCVTARDGAEKHGRSHG
jgi:hypothetical protein